MRTAVAGGTGMVGKLVVEHARAAGHDVVVMARSRGVDLVTGAGVDDALRAMAAGGMLPIGDFRRGEVTFDQWLGVR